MRSSSSSNESSPSFGTTISPSRTKRLARTFSSIVDELGEVARERLPRLGHQVDLRAVAEGDAAEAVPLGLVLPRRPDRQLVDEPRLHRRVAARQGKRHSTRSRRNRPRVASSGFQRSPSFFTRAGTLPMWKSSIATPRSISFHVTGVETGRAARRARRVDRREGAAPRVLVVVDEHAALRPLRRCGTPTVSSFGMLLGERLRERLGEASTPASAAARARSGRRCARPWSRSSSRAASCRAPRARHAR